MTFKTPWKAAAAAFMFSALALVPAGASAAPVKAWPQATSAIRY